MKKNDSPCKKIKMILIIKNKNDWNIQVDDIIIDESFFEINTKNTYVCTLSIFELCGIRRVEKNYLLLNDKEYIFDDGNMDMTIERSYIQLLKQKVHLELLYSPDLPFYKNNATTLHYYKH